MSADPITTVPTAALIARHQALQVGLSPDDIKRRLHSKEWVSLRPGAYARSAVLASLTPTQRHVLQIRATMPEATEAGSGATIVSHASAAVLHGLELISVPVRRVTVTKPTARTGRRTSVLHVHAAPIHQEEIVRVGPHRVTSVARTIVDLARCLDFDDAVAITDSALHHKKVTRDQLDEVLARAGRRPRIRAAHRVVAFASPSAESVGESRSRTLLAREMIPTPTLQIEIRTSRGVLVATCDFGWIEERTVGEFDGAEKYGRLLRPGERAGDKIFKEKVREDRIRELGWKVVRWTWSDLEEPGVVGDRVRRALG